MASSSALVPLKPSWRMGRSASWVAVRRTLNAPIRPALTAVSSAVYPLLSTALTSAPCSIKKTTILVAPRLAAV
ncbi:hypothetical protein BJX62DRAFT_220327 [Aspergillus germanicus]